MRSDRLKQVMQELDPSFDESSIGFSKFSKFLAEAASRGLVGLKKMENGQYEITATKARNSRRESGRPRSRRGGARGSRQDLSSTRAEVATGAGVEGKEGLAQAYEALRSVLSDLHAVGKDPVRDSDLKRKMLAADSDFDETELGFAKFSRFLGQAEKDGVVSVSRTERGNLDVSMIKDPKPLGGGEDFKEDGTGASSDDAKGEVVDDLSEAQKPQKRGWFGLRFGSRRGSKNDSDEAPKLFEGQGVKATMGSEHISSDPSTELLASQESLKVERSVSRGYNTEEVLREVPAESDMADTEDVKVSDLALPSDPGAIARYLTHRYKGVGEKTADTLVKELGSELFRTMHENPDYIAGIIPKNRAEQVLEAWRADYERRARGHRGWSRAKNRES
tara:strand:- start:898 stop:2073 length:1176 start_codon:yes stop_codon:yes gene_type:complete